MNMIDFFFTKEFAPKRGRKLYKKHKHDTENKILECLQSLDYDLIVCAGWMHIFSKHFLNSVSPMLSMHSLGRWSRFSSQRTRPSS